MGKRKESVTRRHPKPFPWRCSTCGTEAVREGIVQHVASVKHHGKLHEVRVEKLPVLRCYSCDAILLENNSHEMILRQLRDDLKLLQPKEIRDQRKERGLKQREVAKEVAAAPTTLCKWEQGVIVQSRRADNALRDFFRKTPVRTKTTCADSDQGAALDVATQFLQFLDACIQKVLSAVPSAAERESLVYHLFGNKNHCADLFAASAELSTKCGHDTIRDATRALRMLRNCAGAKHLYGLISSPTQHSLGQNGLVVFSAGKLNRIAAWGGPAWWNDGMPIHHCDSVSGHGSEDWLPNTAVQNNRDIPRRLLGRVKGSRSQLFGKPEEIPYDEKEPNCEAVFLTRNDTSAR